MVLKVRSSSLLKFLLLITTIIVFSIIVFADTNEAPIVLGKTMDDIDVVAFIADGFDSPELHSIREYLERWGCNVTIAGLSEIVESAYGTAHKVDILISEVNVSLFDCILIPGGGSPYKLVEHQFVLDLVKEAYQKGLVLAAICHGPLVLAKAGVIDGIKVTGHPEIKSDLIAAGGIYVETEAIVDDNIVTGNWPYFHEFSICIAKAFGCYEEDPPEVTDISITPSSGTIGTNFTISAKVSDESKATVVAKIYNITSSERDLILTVTLTDDDNDGIFTGNFTISGIGEFSVDIIATDIYDNSITIKDALSFSVEKPKGEFMPLIYVAAGIVIIAIIGIAIMLHLRKK